MKSFAGRGRPVFSDFLAYYLTRLIQANYDTYHFWFPSWVLPVGGRGGATNNSTPTQQQHKVGIRGGSIFCELFMITNRKHHII